MTKSEQQDDISNNQAYSPSSNGYANQDMNDDFEYAESNDGRNPKYLASLNGGSIGSSNKSKNFKEAAKYNKRIREKQDRESEKLRLYELEIEQREDERKWAPVDEVDAKNMKKQAE